MRCPSHFACFETTAIGKSSPGSPPVPALSHYPLYYPFLEVVPFFCHKAWGRVSQMLYLLSFVACLGAASDRWCACRGVQLNAPTPDAFPGGGSVGLGDDAV